MTLFSVFLFFIFATIGMGTLFLTQVYLKLGSFKKNSALLRYASENGIKQGFDQTYQFLSMKSSPFVLSEEEYSELRGDVKNKGEKLIEKLVGSSLPLRTGETWEKMAWDSETEFFQEGHADKGDYIRALYKGVTSSLGKMKGFKHVKESDLLSELETLAGHIPLPSIPFLLDKDLTAEQKKNFSEKNKIDILSSEKNLLSLQPAFSSGDVLPRHAASQLSKALKIEIFHPQDLTAARLRQALGLEVNDEPIPEGIYLIEDDLGLGGVFVQGDVEEMVLAIEGDYQVITFRMEEAFWVLKFSPAESSTIFETPEETFFYDLIPLGIIIVNGSIQSLGSGVVASSGEVIMVKDEEIPCVLQGVDLTIIASDTVTISSHLILQGVKWEEGLPYIKDSNTQLHIFTPGNDFVEHSEQGGQIIIGADSPEETKIQAVLTASNMGFSVEGENKTVHVFGSLQTSEYLSNENELTIKFDERLYGEDALLQSAARTEKPVVYLSFFRVTEWNED